MKDLLSILLDQQGIEVFPGVATDSDKFSDTEIEHRYHAAFESDRRVLVESGARLGGNSFIAESPQQIVKLSHSGSIRSVVSIPKGLFCEMEKGLEAAGVLRLKDKEAA
ncbi:hypothetical protein ACFL1U_02750 [Patescibacteria group bacterium]